MEQEITAHSEGEVRGPDRLRTFLTRSFAVAAVPAIGVPAILYTMGVTVEQVARFWADEWSELAIIGLPGLTVWGYWLVKLALGARDENCSGRMAVVRWVLLTMSMCCFLAFAVYAVAGIRRGYPVRSHWPSVLLFEGLVLLATAHWAVWTRDGRGWMVVVAVVFCLVILDSSQEYTHVWRGQGHYQKRQYEEALREFESYRDKWYERIFYDDYDEGVLFDFWARTYCQLGRFDEARRMYRLVGKRSADGWGRDVEKHLKSLDEGLAIAGRYEAWVRGQEEFPYDITPTSELLDSDTRKYFVLSDVARTYRYDLTCDAKALEVYRRMADLDVPESCRKGLQADIRTLEKKVHIEKDEL